MTVKNKLLFFLSLKAIALILLIYSGVLHLAPDEAQYWTWSQALDFGYYSKPPAIAWQIMATTALFGNTELGVRFGAVVIGFLIAHVLYAIARAVKLSERQAFWAGLLFAFSPLGFYLSFAATTDGGAILFFLLAIWAIVSGPRFIRAGLMVMCGALFKWITFLFWPFVLYPHFKKKELWIGIGVSLLALLPSLYWNMNHDFATFKHVYATAVPTAKKGGNFFDFLGSQAALISPILFVLLVISLFKAVSQKKLLFLAAFPFAVSFYFILSLFNKMQPNWAAYLYPTGFILIAWFAVERAKIWLHIGIWLSIVSIVAVLFLPLPYKMSPFRQNLGWDKIAPALTSAGYNPETEVLFADKYQTTSILSFYGPSQKRAYFFNLADRRRNQFSYWEQMQKGKSGYFVMIENTKEEALKWYEEHSISQLSPYFDKVIFSGAYPLYDSVKYMLVFKTENYNGKIPQAAATY